MWHRYHQTELFWSAGLFWSYSYKFYTSSLTIRLYLTPKSGKLYTIFLYLDNILATNPQWGKLQSSPISPSCWNFSTKFSQITPETWKSNFIFLVTLSCSTSLYCIFYALNKNIQRKTVTLIMWKVCKH